MTPYAKHIFPCTAIDFLGVQEALLATGARWVSGMLPYKEVPEVGIIAIIVDWNGLMTHTVYPETVAGCKRNGLSVGGFTVETKRFYTLDQPVVRETLNIGGQIYDRQEIIAAIQAAGVSALA